jgi:light-regulated signal transduction histidine kinase (bacteriophytochrome)
VEHHLRACWSFPIIGASRVLGTFALYHPRPCLPDASDREAMGRIIGLARIAIERSREQQQILELNADLERRVEHRTAALQTSVSALESFSYSVAHDLRTPLRAVDGYTSIVLLEYAEHLPEEARQMLRRASDSVRNLALLIEGLLTLSRVSRSLPALEPVDMQALATAVAGEVASSRSAKLRFAISALPPAAGDPALLRQVWHNLLDNAAKFSAHREDPVVEVGVLPGSAPIYFVRDYGAGFDMAYESKLFGVFERLHSVGQFEGNGLGLAIVKRIIDHHRGRIWAESAPERGATFYFSLATNEVKTS